MSALYTASSFAQDDIAILYYSIVLTIVTVIVAVIIGMIQLFSLILNVAEPKGPFWDGVGRAGDMYDVIGGCIAGLFVLAGVVSVLAYGPWRKRIDKSMEGRVRLSAEGRDYGAVEEGCGLEVDVSLRQPMGEGGKKPSNEVICGIETERVE